MPRSLGRSLAVVAGFFVACSPFAATEEPDIEAPSTQNEAGADDTAPNVTDGGGSEPSAAFCTTQQADSVLFCDDFSGDGLTRWDGSGLVNPERKPPGNGAEIAVVSPPDVRTRPILRIAISDDAEDQDSCAYAWTRRVLPMPSDKGAAITFAFDLRLNRVSEPFGSGQKNAVAFVALTNQQNRVMGHYLFVHPSSSSAIYEQWTGNSSATHDVGPLPLATWLRVELRITMTPPEAKLFVDATERQKWNFGDTEFGNRIATATVGLGYACTTFGGEVDYDNVLVTAN